MLVKDQITTLNIAILQGIKKGSIKLYGLAETIRKGESTIIAEAGSDEQIGIDSEFDAVVWHRLIDSTNSLYDGRGKTNEYIGTYRVRLVCYSKDICFSDYLTATIAKSNQRKPLRTNYNKQQTIQQEIPEALRNFDIDSYFFTIDYEVKGVISPICLNDFCF